MRRGPKGEKRPADVIGSAVHVMQMPRVSSLAATGDNLSFTWK